VWEIKFVRTHHSAAVTIKTNVVANHVRRTVSDRIMGVELSSGSLFIKMKFTQVVQTSNIECYVVILCNTRQQRSDSGCIRASPPETLSKFS